MYIRTDSSTLYGLQDKAVIFQRAGVLLQCLCPSAMIIMEERHNGTMQTKNKSPDL